MERTKADKNDYKQYSKMKETEEKEKLDNLKETQREGVRTRSVWQGN